MKILKKNVEVALEDLDEEIIENDEPLPEAVEIEDELIVEEVDPVQELVQELKPELKNQEPEYLKSGENGNTTWTIDTDGLLLIVAKPNSDGKMAANNNNQKSYLLRIITS